MSCFQPNLFAGFNGILAFPSGEEYLRQIFTNCKNGFKGQKCLGETLVLYLCSCF